MTGASAMLASSPSAAGCAPLSHRSPAQAQGSADDHISRRALLGRWPGESYTLLAEIQHQNKRMSGPSWHGYGRPVPSITGPLTSVKSLFLELACMVDLAEQEVHQVPGAALMLQHCAFSAGQACHGQRLLSEPLVGLPQLLQAPLPVTLKVPLRHICR